MNIKLLRLSGTDVHRHIHDLARLRMEVFRDYPYLYDGSAEYETRYLKTYINTQSAVLIAAMDGNEIIGMATGLPLNAETPEVIRPLINAGYNPTDIFYFGESVLLSAYRGKGIGKLLMDLRISYAREKGFGMAVFCAVSRLVAHPLKPEGYRSLDGFWQSRGFVQRPDLTTQFRWKDTNQDTEDEKTMVFWLKQLY